MAKCLVGAAGGLTASDKAKLVPENIRAGVTLFEGTTREVVGACTAFAGALQGYKGVAAGWGNMIITGVTTSPNLITYTSGAGAIQFAKGGTYRFFVAGWGNGYMTVGSQFIKNGEVVEGSSKTFGYGGYTSMDLTFDTGDEIIWQAYQDGASYQAGLVMTVVWLGE